MQSSASSKKKKFKSLELFSGAGGLAIGSHAAGCEHAALIEWSSKACETLRMNAKWNVMEGDIRGIDFRTFGDIDLVLGGPPCQPFSLGGKHKGMNDMRDMLPEYARSIKELRPKAFVMENVKGLLRPRFESYFSYIVLLLSYPTVNKKSDETWEDHLARLEEIHTKGGFPDLHYNVVFRLVNAANFGVPQLRERVFVVGFRADLGVEWSFPQYTHSSEALLKSQWVTGKYWQKHGMKQPKSIPSRYEKKVHELDEGKMNLLPWQTIRDVISDLPDPHSRNLNDNNHVLVKGAKSYPGHTGSSLDWPSKTIKAGAHGVPGGENMLAYGNGSVRYLTIREAARIQTFPDQWYFEGGWSSAMKQLGNAVPVRLAQTIASSVVSHLT